MVQVSSTQGKHRHGGRQFVYHMMMAGVLLAPAGCGGKVAPDAPLAWWHDLEGGVVASQRPPPPGAHDPYPKIATVPAKPAPTELATRQRIADSLAAERDQTNAQAALNLAPTTTPARPAPATPPSKAEPTGSRMTVDAVTPAAPLPPAAPVAPVAPLTQRSAATPPALDAVPQPAAAIVPGELPAVPANPPALPAVEGYRVPAAPPSTPAVVPAPAPVVNGVQIAFTPGSSTLPPSAPLTLRTFALAHRGVPLAVVGHGENVRPDADAQGRSLALALKRAQAIAVSLGEAGVPAANLRLSAEAAGSGGLARLN